MISKELLSEVLNKKVIDDDISNIELKENTITFIEDYWDEDEGPGFYRSHTMNIYELAHKCKEWAIKNDFFIFSGYNGNYNCFVNHSGNRFFGDTEPEAIFKAAQWILDNVKTNSIP